MIPKAVVTLPAVAAELAKFRGGKVFFDPLRGDNGTRLIEIGARWLLEDSGIQLVPSLRAADAIVLNGGIWNRRRASIARSYSRRAPRVPMVSLPATFFSYPAPADLAGRAAPVTLFARDHRSMKTLEAVGPREGVQIGLDHDAAFLLPNTEFFRTVKARASKPRHILVVERQDGESQNELIVSSGLLPFVSSSLKERIPLSLRMALKRPINRYRWRRRRQSLMTTSLVEEGLRWIDAFHGNCRAPLLPADVGLPDVYSFQEYVTLIETASAVISTRLHVAIFAGLLDKPTFLRPSANHKIASIYHCSFGDLESVHFVA